MVWDLVELVLPPIFEFPLTHSLLLQLLSDHGLGAQKQLVPISWSYKVFTPDIFQRKWSCQGVRTNEYIIVPSRSLLEGASVHLSVCIVIHHAPCATLQFKTKIGFSNRYIADDVFALNVQIVQDRNNVHFW